MDARQSSIRCTGVSYPARHTIPRWSLSRSRRCGRSLWTARSAGEIACLMDRCGGPPHDTHIFARPEQHTRRRSPSPRRSTLTSGHGDVRVWSVAIDVPKRYRIHPPRSVSVPLRHRDRIGNRGLSEP